MNHLVGVYSHGCIGFSGSTLQHNSLHCHCQATRHVRNIALISTPVCQTGFPHDVSELNADVFRTKTPRSLISVYRCRRRVSSIDCHHSSVTQDTTKDRTVQCRRPNCRLNNHRTDLVCAQRQTRYQRVSTSSHDKTVEQ